MLGPTRSTCSRTRASKIPRSEADELQRRRAVIGSICLISGVVLAVLNAIEMTQGIGHAPRFWVANRTLWWGFTFAAFFGGCWLISGASATLADGRIRWKPARPGRRFRQVVLYTRDECGLCEEALEILRDHADWLPEVQLVEIDGDAVLRERFKDCVPVVAIDGKLRFRGRVSEILLRRLIDATPPFDESNSMGFEATR